MLFKFPGQTPTGTAILLSLGKCYTFLTSWLRCIRPFFSDVSVVEEGTWLIAKLALDDLADILHIYIYMLASMVFEFRDTVTKFLLVLSPVGFYYVFRLEHFGWCLLLIGLGAVRRAFFGVIFFPFWKGQKRHPELSPSSNSSPRSISLKSFYSPMPYDPDTPSNRHGNV